MRTILLLFTAIFLASCASGPRDVIFVNSRVPAGRLLPSADLLAREIGDETRRFQDPTLRANEGVWRMDETVALRSNVNGGLFDVREPAQVNNATLQASMTLAQGSSPISVGKFEIELRRGLSVGQTTTQGEARIVDAAGGKWESTGQYFRFRLDDVDTSVFPARSRGTFEFVARKNGDGRLLLIEGSFNLREFDRVGGFIP